MNVPAYLDRIGYSGPLTPDAEALRLLHRAHMLAVPFENLDISLRREIVCDEDRFLHKIIAERRGGFCYELNGAFAALLRTLGYSVTLLSACVAREDGSDGPEFDHLTLRVDLDEPWLADVGFGDSFIESLQLQPDLEQDQYGRTYRLASLPGGFRLEARSGSAWKREYTFTLQPRRLSDFADMCRYHQTSPASRFTCQRVCSLATPEGRVTLSDSKLIETRHGVKQERVIGQEEYHSCLRDHFGVTLS